MQRPIYRGGFSRIPRRGDRGDQTRNRVVRPSSTTRGGVETHGDTITL